MKTIIVLIIAMLISMVVMADTTTVTLEGTADGVGGQTVTLTSSTTNINLNPTYVDNPTGGACVEPQKEIARTPKKICVCINTSWYCTTATLEP